MNYYTHLKDAKKRLKSEKGLEKIELKKPFAVVDKLVDQSEKTLEKAAKSLKSAQNNSIFAVSSLKKAVSDAGIILDKVRKFQNEVGGAEQTVAFYESAYKRVKGSLDAAEKFKSSLRNVKTSGF